MRSLFAESCRIAVSSRIQSALVFLMCAVVPLLVVAIAGLGVDAQEALVGRLDSVGARVVVVRSTNGQPSIPTSSVHRLRRLSHVAWVVGLGPVIDVRLAGDGASPVAPLRFVISADAPITTTGTDPGALVSEASAARLGLEGAFGSLEPDGTAITGWFAAGSPLQELNNFVLALPRSNRDVQMLDRVILATDDAAMVPAVTAAIPFALGTSATSAATIEESSALQAARSAVLDEIVNQTRLFVIAALVALVILGGSVVFMGVLAARRDFGRRRALGASRVQLTALVILTTAWPALAGATIGATVGWAYLTLQLGHAPDPRFAASVAWLTAVATTVASIGPALIAASRDPLRVLRVP